MLRRLIRTSAMTLSGSQKINPNQIPYGGKECESLYRTFLDHPGGEEFSSAATVLLSHFYQRRRERWNEAIDSIDFSDFSCLAWSTLNSLIGSLIHTSCKCLVLANSTASQVVRNRIFPVRDCKSTRSLRDVRPWEGLNTKRSESL